MGLTDQFTSCPNKGLVLCEHCPRLRMCGPCFDGHVQYCLTRRTKWPLCGDCGEPFNPTTLLGVGRFGANGGVTPCCRAVDWIGRADSSEKCDECERVLRVGDVMLWMRRRQATERWERVTHLRCGTWEWNLCDIRNEKRPLRRAMQNPT